MGSPHSFLHLLIFAIFLLLLCAPSVNGAITNTTVDDTSSAFTFTGSWTAVSASNPCAGCASKPDASQTFDASWHDGNYRTGASETTGGSFTFTGSAVYIFGIDQAKSQPDIAFTLGSIQSTHHYTGTERFVYNALFFSATGLAADATHTVNWIFNIDPSTGVGVQAALFDYAIVTSGTDDPTPNLQPTTSSTTQAPQSKTQTTTSTQSSSTTTTSSPSTADGQGLAGHQSSSSTHSGTVASLSQSKTSSSSPTKLSASSSPSADTLSGALSTSVPQSAASEARHTNVGAIVGAVLGVLVFAVLTLILLFICRRHRQRQRAREDDERRAAGLPPAPPNMRRIRGNPVLQPFVDDRPPEGPLADNVFAVGTFATASSAGAAVTPSAGALGPSAAAGAPGTIDPSTGTALDAPAGTGTFVTMSAAGHDAPPAFVDTVATLGRYPAEKTQDMGYTNAHSQPGPSNNVSRQPSQSTQSGLSRIDTLMSPSDKFAERERERERDTVFTPSTVLSPSTALSPSDTSTSARERYLEQRLATLEAHVANYLPPPYEHPEP